MDHPCVGAALLLALFGCEGAGTPPSEPEPTFDYPLDDSLRLEHIQAKSTHNSYHVESEGNELDAWAYSHRPLDEQAGNQGVRHFELDLSLNPDSQTFDVVHIPLLDDETTCFAFTDCLATLKRWSDAHPAHLALVVQLELKDNLVADYEAYFAALHAAITSVWPAERIVTPDAVREGYATLGEAIRERGWPTLGALRNKVIFTLDDGGDFQRAYTYERTTLDGRLLFAESSPGEAFAAITVANDPFANADAIAAALADNMLVRTRADSDSVEPLANDTARRDAALASGAQFVSTDYPAQTPATPYWLDIPGGTPSRCNPVTAPPECTSLAVEDPAYVGP